MVNCSNCGAENPSAHSFCSNCGNELGRTCPSCGTPNDASNKFCFNCGTGLEAPTTSSVPKSEAGERRLVSVVFADLVGYTSLSEGRDPEDIRSMLTEYYDRCREIISRYGGVTDKFIGDAVMAVFGADAAHEDDAERATRTALELVDMVRGLGGDVGMSGLDARAGVMSGEASVGSGGNEHGLVVGDLVNTASRLQSIAPPGGVYVGESTKDLVGGAVEFRAAGDQQVKGKEVPVAAYQALRVLALSQSRHGGELSEGPFVGRDDELRMLKDQLHATGREQRARMVSVIGEAGIGKTRLSQELLRYVDGISEVIYYHSGRSPSYGDGVTFWALGEMVRHRAGITEGEEPAKSRMRLRTAVAQFVPDEDDQRWIEPRLAALIGLIEMPPGDRSELYAALRTFFQRIAEQGTVLMVFEDLHWGDEGLLDFIEELVERSTQSPVLVLALARPELMERRSDWGATRRRSLLMHLSRLDDDAMRNLVDGLVPGIPADLAQRVATRAAGVPLHAVEFVRMLVNSGELFARDGEYEFGGEVGQLAIPDSVSAIISARLDRLDPDEASVVQDASVLGLSFTLGGIADLQGRSTEDVEPLLRSLVRRDVLEFDEDPRSPERGQYRFVQSLIKEVAYGRLSKADRVSRHLEVARRTEGMNDPELAAVVASHYASAAEADPNNIELGDLARNAIVASAERARALHSDVQAAALFRRAIDLTADRSEQAKLKLHLTACLESSGRDDLAFEVGSEALEHYEEVGDVRGIAEAATCLAHSLAGNFEAGKAAEIILPVYETTPQTDDIVWARLAAETSRTLALANRGELAVEVADRALPVLERMEYVEELLETLNNKALGLTFAGRVMEALAILEGVASMAADRGLLAAEGRALNNISATSQIDTQLWDYSDLRRVIEKSGDLGWQIRLAFFGALDLYGKGDLEGALASIAEGEEHELSEFWVRTFELERLRMEQAGNGVSRDVHERILELNAPNLVSDDPQIFESGEYLQTAVLFTSGDFDAAVRCAVESTPEPWGYPESIETGIAAAAMKEDRKAAGEMLDRLLKWEKRGRAFSGLVEYSRMVDAALRGDVESALTARERMAELWEATMPPLKRAHADAVTAAVFPGDHPAAVDAARAAEDFFITHGFKAYLDLYADVFARYRADAGDVAV